ncbi:uncharacterized protein Z518_01729 [Rhinocladiella mackenziei CBS 650.93]|uniref:BRCT domain-containing protein n=1 Tax=Rhinocladiella mackenziei CBS 650.93 TaxID=1442369 RepID=A0A0D2JMG1_9EURO|nr:uncharacterized protein Z518_01729 [Rhinocladiella mackenziei CBS 650.93]KIX10645.1 hypothetical protein Z518_01729 [Rhinocladiella mackenziei CBS 650.93]
MDTTQVDLFKAIENTTSSLSGPPSPQPTRVFFDPFNSSSTGHQRAENRLTGSTSWKKLRDYKLSHQFRHPSGRGGERYLSDLVGAGSENYGQGGRKDNRDGEKGTPGLREKGWQDIRQIMNGSRKRSIDSLKESEDKAKRPRKSHELPKRGDGGKPLTNSASEDIEGHKDAVESSFQPPQIFRNLNIYVNGSTAPVISDHKLKQLFTQHGGTSSVALGRRTVTHVILGDTCGGGLASSKIQKEVALVGGKGIKYVTVQWVLDSIDKMTRQPESKYVPKSLNGRIGGSGQVSVRGMFPPKTK